MEGLQPFDYQRNSVPFVAGAISLLASRKTRACDLVEEKRWLLD